jgi:hypothetical protein
MKHQAALVCSTWVILVLGGGCIQELAEVPEDVRISCTASNDCPTGYICAEEVGRCLKDSLSADEGPGLDGTPTISPEIGKVGTEFTLRFEVTAPVGEDPFVRADIGGRQAPFLMDSQSDPDSLSYVFTYVADGSEATGDRDILIDLQGPLGKKASGLAGGRMALDFSPPSLFDISLAPQVAAAGNTSTLSFTVDEPTSEPPSVSMTSVEDSNLSGLVWTLSSQSGVSDFVFEFTPDGSELAGDYEISVVATDIAGNVSPPRPAGILTLDFNAPVCTHSVTHTLAAPGDSIWVTVNCDERPTPGAQVFLRQMDALDIPFNTPQIEGTGLSFHHQVETGEDGIWEVVLTDLSDAAGNAQPEQILGTLVVDGTAPQIVPDTFCLQSASATACPNDTISLLSDDTLTVAFQVSEPLLVAPEVSLRDLPIPMLSNTGLDYVYEIDVGGTGLVGTWPISISMIDLVNHGGYETPGTASLDTQVPQIVNIQFSPAAAQLDSTVVLTLTVSESVTDPANPDGDPRINLTFDTDPGFVFVGNSGLNYNYQLVVDGTVNLPSYSLQEVALTDEAGNAQTYTSANSSELPAMLTVDNSPPLISNLSADRAAYSEAMGFNQISLTFNLSEDLDAVPNGLSAVVDGTLFSGGCGAYQASSPNYTCTHIVDATQGSGFKSVVVTARDAAGNASVEGTSVEFDFDPPGLQFHSVSPSPVDALATDIAYSLIPDELLDPAIPPTLTVGGPQALAFIPPSSPPWIFNYTVLGTEAPGTYTADITLTDAAGNSTLLSGAAYDFVLDVQAPAISNIATNQSKFSTRPGFNQISLTFDVDENLDGVTNGLRVEVDANAFSCGTYQASSPNYTCTYTLASGTEGVRTITVLVEDASGNSDVGSINVEFDFTPPAIASAAVVYVPDPSNVLGAVDVARNDTAIRVIAVANEAISQLPADAPTLVISGPGGSVNLPAQSVGTGDAVFEAVPGGISDGTYTPTVTWTDSVGNRSSGLTFSSPAIRVDTSTPTLSINQARITYWRSPLGNASSETLGGFTVPAGPYFALAPGDPLSTADSVLAADVFSLDPDGGGPLPSETPSMIRVWSDAARTSLLGSDRPNGDDTWPRTRLASVDSPLIYISGLDSAGNETTLATRITNSEWVGTTNNPVFGDSPHTTRGLAWTTSAREPDAFAPVSPLSGLAGSDGQATVVAAEMSWTERDLSGARPSPRQSQGAYDSARERYVLFGGATNDGRVGDTWEWDGHRWNDVSPDGVSPPARLGHSMAFDAARGVTVLYGGADAGNAELADTWEWDGVSWTERFPVDDPGVLSFFTMAYDPSRGVTVIFGGSDGSNSNNDVFEWDGTNWTLVDPGGMKPIARSSAGLFFDPVAEHLVLFGGYSSVADCNGSTVETCQDTWAWDGVSWTELTPASGNPPPRAAPFTTYDPVGNVGFLFGGSHSTSYYSDVWTWNGTSWTQHFPSNSPLGRRRGTAFFDPTNGEIAVAMGRVLGSDCDGSGNRYCDSTWLWDGNRWLDGTPSTAPPNRWETSGAYDTSRKTFLVFGGLHDTSDCNGSLEYPCQDLWSWNGTRWTDLTPGGTKPLARYNHAVAYDATNDRLVVFGGWSGAADCNGSGTNRCGDTWVWNGSAWADVTPGSDPSPRSGPAMAFDSSRDRVVLFGGNDNSGDCNGSGKNLCDDTWEWNGTTWSKITPSGSSPTPRSDSQMVFDSARGVVVLFGGDVEDGDCPAHPSRGDCNDTWEWNGTAWTEVTPAGTSPPRRYDASLVYDSDRQTVVLFGGYGSGCPSGVWRCHDTWEWDGATWQEISPRIGPVGRGFAASGYDASRKEILVFGGNNGDPVSELWVGALSSDRVPSTQLDASLVGASILPEQITDIHVRAHCGADYSPYGAMDAGASLWGWQSSENGFATAAWMPLGTNTTGLNAMQPFLPAAPGALIDWQSANASEAVSFLTTRDERLSFRCEPIGDSGTGGNVAQVAMDYAEVRVRYASP